MDNIKQLSMPAYTKVVSLFPDQLHAMWRCLDFIIHDEPSLRIIRFKAKGGTGKTHTIREFIKVLQTNIKGKHLNPAVVSLTGRAASQLSKGGIEATTCHRLLYTPVVDDDGDLTGWQKNPPSQIRADYDYIIIDEGSMASLGIIEDLMAINLPIIIMGDHKQLDAVDPESDDPEPFNIMDHEPSYWGIEYPDISLTINRRVDPECTGIMKLTEACRHGPSIPRIGGAGLKWTTKKNALTVQYHRDNQFDVIICGMHKTRKNLNNLVRRARGYDGERAEKGEQLICKTNTVIGGKAVYNGDIVYVTGRIDGEDRATYFMTHEDGSKFQATVLDATLTDEYVPRMRERKKTEEKAGLEVFFFGYAITVHSAQGSTFDNLLFFHEDVSFFISQQKFNYTGTSRAAKSLTMAI